ncbi:hypothetical protein QJS10_CPA03g00932 [Acorus calamus]|uniref:Uncharacterized protein n=1 Tax=Acorus calamus TaxID=4465 RepID=A0AAV9F4X4_ACOCL|nr:hypothetical protein QJS10_CPA03g00932 [Acorus calamus]
MADHNPFYPYKTLGCNVKSRDASECASTTGPLEECREPMKMWEEIKRNGFLSTPHGSVPTPKQWETLRQNKNGAPKKKAKNGMREQTKKLMNISAPSGLLAGLNPGIIYHVRNTKQVRSIIDNVVISERLDGQIENKNIGHEESNNKGGLKRLRDFRHYDEQTSDVLLHEADPLALKLSSAVNTVSEDTNSGSKEEFSASHDNISSLSVKALRRSRKRVRNTIQRDLPVIFSKDFSSNQENDPHFSQPQSADATSDIARWRAIFCNMDKALLDEGEQLENRLSQVKEMQLHCERGLQYVSPTAFPRSNPMDNSRKNAVSLFKGGSSSLLHSPILNQL